MSVAMDKESEKRILQNSRKLELTALKVKLTTFADGVVISYSFWQPFKKENRTFNDYNIISSVL